MDGNWKLTLSENLGPCATKEPGFPGFFSTTCSPRNFVMAEHSFYSPSPRIFAKKGAYETNIKPQIYSFHVIFNSETMLWSFRAYTVFSINALGLQYMSEKTPTKADFSLLSSLPPPTSEIVIDKIPYPTEKCQLKPTSRLPSMGRARIFAGTALRCRWHVFYSN